MVVHPVRDLDAAIAFYTGPLGLSLKFRDGDRFAALDAAGTTIALAAGGESAADRTAVSYKVDDVAACVAALRAAGARVLREPARGPHETRAVLADPAGNPFIVYASHP